MIGTRVTVIIDRPLGSVHPQYPMLHYPVNYGYVQGVFAADGEEQDAYILGVDTPLEQFSGTVIAVIERENDVEDKWVVAPDGELFSIEEIQKAVHFQEQYFFSKIRMIRLARPEDMTVLMNIYAVARRYMASTGNPNQWPEGHPSADMLAADIAAGNLYVEEQDGIPRAAFAFIIGEDPTYGYIEDGAWLSDSPYGTIHRLASDGTAPGFFSRCVAFCHNRMPHLRVDTHRDNRVMQHLAEKEGFTRCGIIYLANGSPRIAYERTE